MIEEYDPATAGSGGTLSNGFYYVGWGNIIGNPGSNGALVEYLAATAGADLAARAGVVAVGAVASNAVTTNDGRNLTFTGKMAIGYSNPSLTRFLYVGNRGLASVSQYSLAVDTAITNDAAGTNAYGIADVSDIWRSGRINYHGFSTHNGMMGTNDYAIYMAYYDAMAYDSSGSIGEIASFVHYPRIEQGIASNVMGAHIYDMRTYSHTGTVYNQYGIYVDELKKGVSNNYAFYSAGATTSRFGNVVVGTYLFSGYGITASTVARGDWFNSISNKAASAIDAATAGQIATNVAVDGYLSLTPDNRDIEGNGGLVRFNENGNEISNFAVRATGTLTLDGASALTNEIDPAFSAWRTNDAAGLRPSTAASVSGGQVTLWCQSNSLYTLDLTGANTITAAVPWVIQTNGWTAGDIPMFGLKVMMDADATWAWPSGCVTNVAAPAVSSTNFYFMINNGSAWCAY